MCVKCPDPPSKWLRKAREYAPPDSLHLLTLAFWGLENGVEGEWPERDRPALEEQVGLLLGWDPHNALKWLLWQRAAQLLLAKADG